MLPILFYCLKVLLCSGLMFGYYLLVLRNKQFHEWNRYFLLIVVLLSFALPFVHIPIFLNGNANNSTIIIRGLQFGDYGDEVIIRPNNNWQINWSNMLVAFYVAISSFFLIKLLKTFNWIKKIKSAYPSEMLEEIQFYNTTETGTPFSFFKNIFWHNTIEPSSSKGLQMLRHEITHVRQLHSADKLFMEITTIIAWWNPFFHLIKKELSTIHEFIADQHAALGDDNLQYASLLLSKALGSNNIPITNPFFHSQLKRRIAMLTTIKNPRFSYLRRLMVLPVAATLFILMAFKFKEKKNADLKTPVPITIVIDAGHGGIDDGAFNKEGIKEKDITLSIAQKIASLSTSKNIKVVLTRNNDELPGSATNVNAGLKQRIAIATNSNADLFISLHINSSNNILESGISALITKTSNKSLSKSQLIASSLLDELAKSGLPVTKQIQQSREKGVWILDQNPLPAVLLELGYLNNTNDVSFILNPKNQEKLANEILDGLIKAASSLKDKNNQTSTNNQPPTNSVLQGFWQDSIKNKKETKPVYKGHPIAAVNVTDDGKGYLVNTTDGKNYFVTKAEAKKEWANGMPQIQNQSTGTTVNIKPNTPNVGQNSNIQLRGAFANDSTKPILYIVDGVEKTQDILPALNPDEIKSISVLKGESATNLYGDRGKYGVILILTKKKTDAPIAFNTFYQDTANDYNKTFTKVEEPATFPGGLDGWRNYLVKNLRYPEDAQNKKIQGVVRVQLVVDKKGHVSEVKALNNLGGGLSEEAERVIKTGPNWVPAKQNGKLVTYRFVQTLTFQLQ